MLTEEQEGGLNTNEASVLGSNKPFNEVLFTGLWQFLISFTLNVANPIKNTPTCPCIPHKTGKLQLLIK